MALFKVNLLSMSFISLIALCKALQEGKSRGYKELLIALIWTTWMQYLLFNGYFLSIFKGDKNESLFTWIGNFCAYWNAHLTKIQKPCMFKTTFLKRRHNSRFNIHCSAICIYKHAQFSDHAELSYPHLVYKCSQWKLYLKWVSYQSVQVENPSWMNSQLVSWADSAHDCQATVIRN